ncbi:hypothetical protein K2X85_05770 [bacterium]|nr:hypothetical protein [bacterium]
MDHHSRSTILLRVAGCFCLLATAIVSTGCVSTGSLLQKFDEKSPASPITDLAVVAEADVAKQEGKDVPGLVVQAILMDEQGRPISGDGSLIFSLYAEDAKVTEKMEPDDRFTFTGEQLRQSAVKVSLGTVHNFWLPKRGKLVNASRVQLVTVYRPTTGEPLAQSNLVSNERRKLEVKETKETVSAPIDSLDSKSQIEPAVESMAKKLIRQKLGTSGTDK